MRNILTLYNFTVSIEENVPKTDDIFKIHSTLVGISYKNEVHKIIFKAVLQRNMQIFKFHITMARTPGKLIKKHLYYFCGINHVSHVSH